MYVSSIVYTVSFFKYLRANHNNNMAQFFLNIILAWVDILS